MPSARDIEGRAVVLGTCRAALGLLTLAAVTYELVHGLEQGGWSTVNYFSYFTELSNLFAAAIFLIGAYRVGGRRSTAFDLLRGASVLYMLTTGIVYAVLLSGQVVIVPWVNTVLHQVMPLAVLADWLIDPPRRRLPLRGVLLWMAFPVVYIAYTLVRGPLAHWYPYFFVNPNRPGGYLLVAGSCLGIAVGQVALSGGIAWVGNGLGGRGLRVGRRGERAAALPPAG